MKINLTLNEEEKKLEFPPETPLSEILRNQKLFSVKKNTEVGNNSFCTVLLDEKPVPSDIIPFAILKNAKIETLEHFMQTENYKYIEQGFEEAGIKLCGYCNADKIFTAWDIIANSTKPSTEDIERAIANMSFCCVNKQTYIKGIRFAIAQKNKHIGNRRNARK